MEKTKIEELKEKLFYNPKHASEIISADETEVADSFCEGYKSFLDKSKTEREAAAEIIALAKADGEAIEGGIEISENEERQILAGEILAHAAESCPHSQLPCSLALVIEVKVINSENRVLHPKSQALANARA